MSHTSGGRVSMIIGGIVYSARGAISLSGSGLEVTDGANQDGSVYRTVAPKSRKAEMTFDRFVAVDGGQLRWSDEVMSLENLAATFIELDGKKQTHLLSGCFFVGTPTFDMATGEISGLSLAGDVYKTINN